MLYVKIYCRPALYRQNSRQRALMQILYQRCEFSSDMLPESEIRKRIGFNYSLIGGILQCLRNNILPAETNIEDDIDNITRRFFRAD